MTDFITELTKSLNEAFNLNLANPDTLKPIVIAAADNTLKAAVTGQHQDVTLSKKEIAYVVAALMVGQRKDIVKQLKPKKG